MPPLWEKAYLQYQGFRFCLPKMTNYAYFSYFDKSNLSVVQNIRYRGYSVRLVRDAE